MGAIDSEVFEIVKTFVDNKFDLFVKVFLSACWRMKDLIHYDSMQPEHYIFHR